MSKKPKYLAVGKLETKMRMEEALHRRLMQIAEEKGVSFNSEVRARLQASLDENSPEEKRDISPPEPAAPLPIDESKTVAALQAENAQLREIVSRHPSALSGKLSTAKIAKLISDAKNGKFARRSVGDGGNLQLQINSNSGAASWIFRYNGRRFGKGRDIPLGLGSYPDVDLDMARVLAHRNRLMLKAGKDPEAECAVVKLDRKIAEGRVKTVSQVANEYFNLHIAPLTEGTRWQVTQWLKTFVHDTIGDMPIEKVDRNTILEECELAELWAGQNPTARGLQNHLERMFELAIDRGWYHGKNPIARKGLKNVLPKVRHRVKHHDALPYQDIGRFMGKLRAYKDPRGDGRGGRTTVSLCVEFIALTGVRLSEARTALWKEIDTKLMVWNVPPEHLKTGHIHGNTRAVPITKPMLAVLEEMQKRRRDQSPDAVLFPAQWSRDGLLHRENVSTFIRKQLGWETHITNHGFRSTLRDWCRAEGRFPEVWWKRQVDHVTGDKTDQSYGHNDLMDERRGMMELWGKYCSKPAPEPQTGDVVVSLADKRRPA